MEEDSWGDNPDNTGYDGLCEELKFYSRGNAKSFDETMYAKFLINFLVSAP